VSVVVHRAVGIVDPLADVETALEHGGHAALERVLEVRLELVALILALAVVHAGGEAVGVIGEIAVIRARGLRDEERGIGGAVAVETEAEVGQRAGLDGPEKAKLLVLIPRHRARHAAGEVGAERPFLVVPVEAEVRRGAVFVRRAAALIDRYRADRRGLAAERIFGARNGRAAGTVGRRGEVEVQVAAEEFCVVAVILGAGRHPQRVVEFVVDAHVAVVAHGGLRRIAEAEARDARDLGVVVGEIGIEGVVGHLGLLLGKRERVVVAGAHAEALVEKYVGVIDAPVRLEAGVVVVVPTGLLLPRQAAHGVERKTGADTDQPARAVEGAAAAQIHDTGQRAAGIFRLRCAAQLDGLDAVDRHLFEFKRAVGARAARRGHARAGQR
jgi:hypothetical protein